MRDENEIINVPDEAFPAETYRIGKYMMQDIGNQKKKRAGHGQKHHGAVKFILARFDGKETGN